MPRVSRNVVEFPVDGVVYEAKFLHAHADRGSKGKLQFTDTNGKVIDVQHITTCILRQKGNPVIAVRGLSTCSLKETYLWRKGIKLAFQRAIVKMGYAVEVSVAGKPKSIRSVQGQGGKYGKFMASFFREMRLREIPGGESGSEAKVEIPILDGKLVEEPRKPVVTVGGYPLIPHIGGSMKSVMDTIRLQHGYGHCGTD